MKTITMRRGTDGVVLCTDRLVEPGEYVRATSARGLLEALRIFATRPCERGDGSVPCPNFRGTILCPTCEARAAIADAQEGEEMR